MPASRTPPRPKEGKAPTGFRVARDLPLGRHPILTAFPGLDRLPTAARQEPNAALRKKLHADTFVELVADDLWMYVAPWKKLARYREWRPVVAPQVDCIVVGEGHLRESDSLILFLDIFHELCHIRQRHDGAELFGGDLPYVERPTEVGAYQFVVEEARRLRVDDDTVREYLKVEWIDDKEYLQLLDACGVPHPPTK